VNTLRRNTIKAGSLFFLCCFLTLSVFSQGQEPPDTPLREQEDAGADTAPQERFFLPALGNTLLSNFFLHVINRYVGQANFAKVTVESIEKNLRSEWDWDQNRFATNQLGHPYQGAMYHTAGRANGFNFYESFFFDALGSYTWEVFAEPGSPSLNDFITTTTGGAALGEMLHRLFLEADYPLAVLINPMDSFNHWLTGRPERYPEQKSGTGCEISFSTGMSWIHAERFGGRERFKLDSWDLWAINFGARILYGNPFEPSAIPYTHFELDIKLDIGYPWYSGRIVSDGYLFSFSPLYDGASKLSTGMSFNFDVFTGTNINFSSQGLDWAVKYQRSFPNNLIMRVKTHAGWTILGVANYYQDSGFEKQIPNYGTGVNAKLFFSLDSPSGGTLSLSGLLYKLFIIPGAAPDAAGSVFSCFFDISYAYPLGTRLSIEAAYSFSGEIGQYGTAPDMEKRNSSFTLCGRWNYP
jgi:hypothetical protein